MKVIGMIGKGIGVIFLVLILLFVAFFIVVTIVTKSNDAYKGDFKSIVKSNEPNAPKALLVYQPGKAKASEEIANQLAKGLNESGYEVTLTYPGKHITDISQYNVVAFGSPVFFGKPSAALTGTMKQLSDYDKKTVIIYSVGQLTESQELDTVKESLGNKNPNYSVKFSIKSDTYQKDAYNLGLKVGEESREK